MISSSHQNNNKTKYCILYFAIISLFLGILIFNYLMTFDAFSENEIANLDPNKTCKHYILRFNICLSNKKGKIIQNNSTDNDSEENSLNILCSIENERLLLCLDNVKLFEKRCEMYLSEYKLCSKKNIKDNSKNTCPEILNDLKTCNLWSDYITINSSLLEQLY